MAQVDVWHFTQRLVHPEVAREIAAWWQSPGTDGHPFAAFASTGTILPELIGGIDREIKTLQFERVTSEGDADSDKTYALSLSALRALRAYVTSTGQAQA